MFGQMDRDRDRDGNSDAGSSRDQQERELATRVLNVQTKRFYVDVKENRRGRYIKLAELAAGHKKTRIILPMSIVAEFRDRLSEFHATHLSLGPNLQMPSPEDGKLKSAVIVKDYRRYFLDLKENDRGRFIRVSLISDGLRSQIGIPAQGILKLRDIFAELIEVFGSVEDVQDGHVEFQGDIPESRSIRVENKTFFFDVGQNTRGVYMKISEVKQNFRSSVTIPERSWAGMRDIITALMHEVRENPGGLRNGPMNGPGPLL